MNRSLVSLGVWLLVSGLSGTAVRATTESGLPTLAHYERYVAIDQVCGWPLLVALPSGEIGAFLWPMPSHGYSEGAVEFWRSRDGGQSWQKVGVPVAHASGENRMNHAGGVNHEGEWVAMVGGWNNRQPALGRPAAELQASAVPFSQSRTLAPVPAVSGDGGRTWQTFEAIPTPTPEDGQGYVPYGRIGRLPDGELGVVLYRGDTAFYVSRDGGRTWARRGQLSGRRTENETAWVRLANGELFAAARTYGASQVVARRSADGGRTWTREGDLTLPGQHPADLTLLPDGRVVLTYGVRNSGQWAVHVRIGDPEARTWSAPLALVDLEGATDQRFADQPGRDGGYPSTVVLEDGLLVTAYYSRGMPSHNRYHVGVVRWRLPVEPATSR